METPTTIQRSQWKQWAACLSATLAMVSAGTVYGWTTTMIARLTDNSTTDIPVHVSSDESSWVISVTAIGSMIGPFYSVYISATYGRKPCLLQTSIFYIAGWLLILLARSVWYLYCARVILGIGVGMSYTTSPMYVSEVGDRTIRGAVGTLTAVNVFTGSLLACSLGPWVSYQLLAIVLLGIPVLLVLTFVWFPESPYYLVSKGRNAEAAKAIGFFTGLNDPDELCKELEDVRANVGGESGDEHKFSFADVFLLAEPRNRKALLIVMTLILGQQLSGNFSTMQYLQQMFGDAKIGISPDVATIIVTAVGLVSGITSTLTVEGAGRRTLLITASFGCALTLAVLAGYLMLNASGTDLSSASLLPVVDVIIYQVIYQIGLGPMVYVLVGELFPTNVKGIAGAIVTIFDGLMEFIVTKMYEVIFTNVGSHVIYLFFAVSCLVLFVFVIGFVPETKSRTFHEIQDILEEKQPFKKSKNLSLVI